jgi:hypothetical protein
VFEDGDIVDDQGDAAGLFYLAEFSDLVGRDGAPFPRRLALDAQELALIAADQIRNTMAAHAVGHGTEPPDTPGGEPVLDLGLDSTFRGERHLSY